VTVIGASQEKGNARGSERVERDVGSVPGEKPGQRTCAEPAEELDDRLPEAIQRRDRGLSERGATLGFRAQPTLPAIESHCACPTGGRYGNESVGEAAMPGMERRIEHVRQPRARDARERTAEHLDEGVFRALGPSPVERVRTACNGADDPMSLPVCHGFRPLHAEGISSITLRQDTDSMVEKRTHHASLLSHGSWRKFDA
jgi:hypothetical protein